MSPALRHILDLMIYAQADLATGESAAKVYWHADDTITFSIARKQIEKAMIKLGQALTSFPDINDAQEITLEFGDGGLGILVRHSLSVDTDKQPDTNNTDKSVRDQFGIDTMHDVWSTSIVSPEDQGN